jgi:hypothetical protein
MKLLLSTVAAIALVPAMSPAQSLLGRWDLTIKTASETYPSWLEVSAGDKVRVVGQVASVHPGTNVAIQGSHLTFTTTEWLGKQTKVTWDITAAGHKVSGTQTREDGTVGHLSGDPAPAMHRAAPAEWSKPEPLFDGKDLAGWAPIVTGEPGKSPANQWKAINGELVNQAAGANLKTTRQFTDFKLHVDYNCPKDGNSGVYLRGRYEVQVEYEAADLNDKFHGMGSIYGFLPPSVTVPPRPGEWESYDVTLVGRMVTVVRDGITIIDNQEIPGITGGALDSHEGLPGPIYLQGDHTGGMKYRNMTISVPER